MQNGGVVPDPLASDSLSQQTLSASTLPPTGVPTDSDTPQPTLNFNLLDQAVKDAIGLDIPTLSLPDLGIAADYRDIEGNIDFQSAFDDYAAGKEVLGGQEIFRRFDLEVQQPALDAIDAYNAAVPEHAVKNEAYLKRLLRLADPKSVDDALRFRDKKTGDFALGRIELSKDEGYFYNIPGVGATSRGILVADDLDDYSKYFTSSTALLGGASNTGELLTALETSSPLSRKIISSTGELIDAPAAPVALLTEEGEKWMATTIDPGALSLLEARAAEIKPQAMRLKNQIDRLERMDYLSTGQMMAIRDLKKKLAPIERYLADDLAFTEQELNDARKVVWGQSLRESALEKIVLPYDKWKNTRPFKGDLRMDAQGVVTDNESEEDLLEAYQDYKAEMEVKIYRDLLSDSSANLAAKYFGEDGFRLFLDDRDTALGERNNRLRDAYTSWEAGLIDFAGSVDSFMLDARMTETVGTGSIKDGTAFRAQVSEQKAKELRSQYYKREAARQQEVRKLLDTQTKYAMGAKMVETFGQAALVNEQTLLDDFLEIKAQARTDAEFDDFIFPAIQSLPQSTAAQVAGIGTMLLTGNPIAGASVTMGVMQGLVTSKTYYNSYLDPRFDKLSEGQRRIYSIAFGAAESAGEGLDFLTMRMGAKLISGGVTGKAIQDLFGRGVYSRFNYIGGGAAEIRTWAGFARDLSLGFAGAMSLNAGGEYIAEGGTGAMQYMLDRIALGEPIDYSEAMDIAHHDGKIGIYAGLISGGAMSGLQTSAAGIESSLFEARFDHKARMLAMSQYINSGSMEGVENEKQAEQLRKLNQSLRDQERGVGDVMSPQEIENARQEIKSLTEKAAAEKENLAKEFEALEEQGRYDIIADLIAIDNREMFLEWALSFDERQIVIDGMGAARTEDGKLAKGYGSRLDSQLGSLTEKEKEEYTNEIKELRTHKKAVRTALKLGLIPLRYSGFGKPNRASLPTQTEAPEDGYVLLADEEGNMVLNVDEATLANLSQEEQELLEEAAQYANSAKGQARIIVHKNKESLTQAVGQIKGNALYLEASEEQREGGIQDEVHVVLQEGGAEAFRTDLVHEAGHFRFRDLVNDEEARKKMVQEITELANKNPGSFVDTLYRAVQKAYSDKSLEDQEKELINHFVQAVAQGRMVVDESILRADLSEITGGLERWGLADMFGQKTVSSLDAVIIAQQFAAEIAETTEFYGAFNDQDFENLVEFRRKEDEMQERQFSAQEEGESNESIVAMESRSLGGKTKFLENTTISYVQVFDDLTPRGAGRPRSRTRQITVKDYNHYRNFYIKMTGNGSVTSNMANMTYEKDGKLYSLRPPRLRTDRQGNLVKMEAPRVEGFTAMTVRNRQERAQFEKEGVAALAIKNQIFSREFSSSVVTGRANMESFMPLNLLQASSESGMRIFDLNAQERLAATDYAIANIQALNKSDLTRDDIAERGEWLSIEDNQDIFNMAGGEYQTRKEKIDILNEAIEELGKQPWQLLPIDSFAHINKHRHFGLATNEDLDAALDNVEHLRNDGQLPSGQMSMRGSVDSLSGLEGRELSTKNVPASQQQYVKTVSEFLQANGITDLSQVLISIHQVDWTSVGKVTLPYKLPDGTKKTISINLSGGPRGAIRAQELGLDVAHTNTNEQSAMELFNYAKTAADQNKAHLILLSLLNAENAMGNPQVFRFAMAFLKKYLSEVDDATAEQIADSFNSGFRVQAKKRESSLYSHPEEILDPTKAKKDKVTRRDYEGRVIAAALTPGFIANTPGVRQGDVVVVQNPDRKDRRKEVVYSDMLEITSKEGLLAVVDRLIELSDGFGFKTRTEIVRKVFAKNLVKKVPGIPSIQDFLNAVNDPALENARSGDIFTAILVDGNNVRQDNDLRKSLSYGAQTKEQKDFVKGLAYTTGITGATGVALLSESVNAAVIQDLVSVQKTGGLNRFVEGTKLAQLEADVSLATKPKGVESRRLGGRIYVEGGDAWTASTPTPYGAVLQRAALRLQDKYSDVMLLQQDVEKFRGSKVPQSQDFEMAMDIFYGIVRTDLERIEGFLDNINSRRDAFGISSNDLSDYLYARHAVERNKFIEQRSPGNTEGSGMSNERAEELLEKLESPEMRILANLVYDVVEVTRNFMVEGGLETRAVVDEWRNRFKNYVPLNGLAVDETDEATSHYPTGGAGMAIYGPSVRKAVGRESETGANILGNVIMQAMAVAQRARKDQAMLSMYKLVRENPNSDVWSVHGPKNRIVSMGQKLNDQQSKAREDVVPIRINGEQHFIKFKDVSHAQALNGMTVEKLDTTSKLMAKYTGFLRNSYTVYNPAFFLSNFARDLHSAIYNAASEIERDGGILEGYGLSTKEFNKALFKTTFNSLGILLKSAHGGEITPEMQELIREWEASGGRTGWSYSDSLNKLVAELGDKTVDKSKTGKALQKAWGNSIGGVLNYVEGINEAFENSIRLAAYIEARKAGMTKQRSAQLSKNITVNFNKSGTISPSINSYFLFFNAAVQGLSRFDRTFEGVKAEVDERGEKRGRFARMTAPHKIAIGMVMFEYAKTIINILVSGVRPEDDELYYNTIPDYKKQRNTIIMLGPEDPLMVPLPYGMNIFSNVGMVLAEMTLGERSPESAAAFLALSAQASFSPISFGQGDNLLSSAVSTALPSALKPAAEVAFNSTYFGGKVYQEQYPFGTETPEYSLAFRSPEFAINLAKYLNEMTDGREKISGDINVNPDPYYYLLLSLTGGAGKFTAETLDLGRTGVEVVRNAINETTDSKGFLEALRDTEKPRVRRSDIPIIKILYGEGSRFFDYDLFDKNRLEVEQYVAQGKAYKEGEDVTIEGLDFTGITELENDRKEVEKVLGDIRSARKQVRDNDEMDYIRKQNLIQDLYDEERKAIMYFNARYYDLRGKYVDPKPQGLVPTQTLKQVLGIYGQ